MQSSSSPSITTREEELARIRHRLSTRRHRYNNRKTTTAATNSCSSRYNQDVSVIRPDLYEPSSSYLQAIKPIQERQSNTMDCGASYASSLSSSSSSFFPTSTAFLLEVADNFPFEDEEERHFMDRPPMATTMRT